MRQFAAGIIAGVILGSIISQGMVLLKKQKLLSPLAGENPVKTEKPLDKYTYENLKKRVFIGKSITLGKLLNDQPEFSSRMFYYTSDGKKVSGLANFPKRPGNYPIIVMFRGFVDPWAYSTGEGTVHAGEVFARNGFITLAPDFLGYGQSASPSADAMEERFETYTTALNLLASLKNLNTALADSNINISADVSKVGIWGHSNGGQVALSVLEISGGNYPTVLWAPVSKPFPYSILYYTDEFDDNGKALRKVVANFEKDYDSEKYSPTNFFNWINAPIELHQGVIDEEVPQLWSDDLYANLKKMGKDITYYTYPTEDHNFDDSAGWSFAVERSMGFYKSKFGVGN